MRVPPVAAVKVLKITSPGSGGPSFGLTHTDDLLAVEEPLEIGLEYGPLGARKQMSLSVTMCTPGEDEELATGFLFTEGIIQRKEDIASCVSTGTAGNRQVIVSLQPSHPFDPRQNERHFYTSSSCGVCGKSSIASVRTKIPVRHSEGNLFVKGIVLTALPQRLRKQQEVFDHTGGLHASALFDSDGELLLLREDVGRHNALDKLIGAQLLSNRVPLSDHILLLSGRASFELVQKAAMAGLRLVCAVGAPSSLAVELASENNMTLVGFLRDGRFNVYCGEERIGI